MTWEREILLRWRNDGSNNDESLDDYYAAQPVTRMVWCWWAVSVFYEKQADSSPHNYKTCHVLINWNGCVLDDIFRIPFTNSLAHRGRFGWCLVFDGCCRSDGAQSGSGLPEDVPEAVGPGSRSIRWTAPPSMSMPSALQNAWHALNYRKNSLGLVNGHSTMSIFSSKCATCRNVWCCNKFTSCDNKSHFINSTVWRGVHVSKGKKQPSTLRPTTHIHQHPHDYSHSVETVWYPRTVCASSIGMPGVSARVWVGHTYFFYLN